MLLKSEEVLLHPSHLTVERRSSTVFDGQTSSDTDFIAKPESGLYVAYRKDGSILPTVRVITNRPDQVKGEALEFTGLGSVGNYRLTYSFSSSIRQNMFGVVNPSAYDLAKGDDSPSKGAYGSSGLSFRMLYELLCHTFNSGQYFIDVYLDKVFPGRSVYRQYSELRKTVSEKIQKDFQEAEVRDVLGRFVSKNNTQSISMIRRKRGLKWRSMKVFQDASVRTATRRVGYAIRRDIKNCMRDGALAPFLHHNHLREFTLEERSRYGFSEDPQTVYFASGQLIDNLQIYIKLLGDDS